MESVDPQNSEQNETSAAEQAAQAPDVATGGAASNPTADTQHQEAVAAQDEPQPAPAEVQTEEQTQTEQQDDPSQLAADGDAVVDGLEENHTNPVTPDEGQ